MNIAVLSDVHSNYVALQACLDYIDDYKRRRGRSIDHIFLLGDYVTDGPFPERTMDLIYQTMEKYPCTCVRGNREEYLLEYQNKPCPWRKSTGTGGLLYAYEHTRRKDWEFFNSLKNCEIVELEGLEPITVMHGSQLDSRDNYFYDPKRGDAFLKAGSTHIMVGGHSHAQHIVDKFGKIYINPGSVGEALDGVGGHAQFCVLSFDDGRLSVENFMIPYDYEKMLKVSQESDLEEYAFYLPKLIGKVYSTGINYFINAFELASEVTGLPPSEVDEETWKKVYEQVVKE